MPSSTTPGSSTSISSSAASEAKLRGYTSFEYQAGRLVAAAPRHRAARGLAAADPLRQEVDIRYVVTSLEGSPQHLYEEVYCQRGQMVG